VSPVRVRIEGPATLALDVATELADADGVELRASERPAPLDGGRVALTVEVEGTEGAVAKAVARISKTLPAGSSINAVTT
jgi:hypothetical protein